MPRMPFSEWIQTLTAGGRKDGAKVGIPTPKLTYMPCLSSLAARRAMRLRRAKAADLSDEEVDEDEDNELELDVDASDSLPSSAGRVFLSSIFLGTVAGTIRST